MCSFFPDNRADQDQPHDDYTATEPNETNIIEFHSYAIIVISSSSVPSRLKLRVLNADSHFSLSPDRELVIVTQYRSQSRIPLDTFRNMEGIEPRSKEEKEVVEEKGLFRNSWR